MTDLERTCRFLGLLTLCGALAATIAVGAAGVTIALVRAVV